jgi:hypothetical protein
MVHGICFYGICLRHILWYMVHGGYGTCLRYILAHGLILDVEHMF